MNKVFLTKVKRKKEAYKKQEQVTCEEHRNTGQVCRDGVRKSKAHQELNLLREQEEQ